MAKITWAGQSCFQISISNSKNHSATIVIDPFDETIGLKVPSLSADILLVTHDHYDHNNIKAVKGNPFLIAGPGECEIKGIYIEGISAFHDDKEGKERGRNTIYTMETEEMRICHLGDLGQKQLTDEQLEKIGSIDILMIPIGGTYTISCAEAQKVISQIEPKIVIPMHYQLPKLKLHPVKSSEGGISPKAKLFNGVKLEGIDKFLKVMGKNSITAENKLTIKSSTLPKEGMEIIILKP